MTLRPRYSLLTLLILTALIAGGTWYWFKPTRFEFDLKQVWDYTVERDQLEEQLRRAAASSTRRHEDSLVYDARRTLTGSKELMAAKFHWKNPPLLVRFHQPTTKHDAYLLTSPDPEISLREIQYNSEHYRLTLLSTEKAICWVSSQVHCLDFVQIDFPGCATGLCHVPVGPEPESRTSYLLSDHGTIYQLNQRVEDGMNSHLRVVALNQVDEPCRAMLSEELHKLQQ